MRATDGILLVKKIAIGALVAAVPLTIILGGLWLTQTLLAPAQPPAAHPHTQPQHEGETR